jgi:DNA-binding HxlR family transcriptional regulator
MDTVDTTVQKQEIDKHEKFLTQAGDSVRKAIVAIEKIGKASNKKQFEYSEEEVEKMFAALQEAVDDTKAMFKEKKSFEW